ncbi:DUF4393 domain-containing protein [Gluconobacter cerevisiae]|nr:MULTISPECIES: Abi-alpha family protein [Gluconobacter]MBF0877449.1 DUF4393 domain-containing protein [Gluconobacter cerevisiae]
MNDLTPLSTDLEQATHALGHVVKAIPGLGEAVYETVRLVWTDPIMRRRRKRNLRHELAMAEEMIEGQKRLEEVSTTAAKQVLEPAMEEDREELQKLWSALIARMLVQKDTGITSSVIKIIKQLDPVDALVLDMYGCKETKESHAKVNHFGLRIEFERRIGQADDANELILADSCQRLMELGCIKYHGLTPPSVLSGPYSPSIDTQITTRGYLVWKLVQPPTKPSETSEQP